jgi:hypothetical protein
MSEYNVEFVGPFVEEWKITHDGYRVPYLSAIRHSGVNEGTVSLSLDERFLIDATDDEARKWIPFIANCMAVAAGYSCFGENSVKDPNPFKVGMIGLSEEPK